MRIEVKVTPRSSQKKVMCISGKYKVYVHESATDGKANQAVVALLAHYFNVSKSRIIILRGLLNRNKIIEICNYNGEG